MRSNDGWTPWKTKVTNTKRDICATLLARSKNGNCNTVGEVGYGSLETVLRITFLWNALSKDRRSSLGRWELVSYLWCFLALSSFTNLRWPWEVEEECENTSTGNTVMHDPSTCSRTGGIQWTLITFSKERPFKIMLPLPTSCLFSSTIIPTAQRSIRVLYDSKWPMMPSMFELASIGFLKCPT